MNRDILDPLKVDIDLKKVSKFERKAFRKTTRNKIGKF